MSRPLKVYHVVRPRRHQRLVAARSRTEAARLLGIDLGYLENRGGETDYPEYVQLAMLAQGVAWEQEHKLLADWQPVGELAHNRVVMARFPDAVPIREYGAWEIRRGDTDIDHLGSGETEEAAWSDAFRRTWLKPPIGVPPNMIVVWRFHKAPAEYRGLSHHGGDEDWIAYLPPTFLDPSGYIRWLGSPHFSNSVSRHPIRSGEIRIGAHA